MPEFNFSVPDDEKPAREITGRAESADRRIRAVIAHDGRLRDLHIAPEVLRRGTRGKSAITSATLAAEITRTINAAFDDLVEQHATAAVPDMADAEAGLRKVTSDVERELSRISADLERTQRRLRER